VTFSSLVTPLSEITVQQPAPLTQQSNAQQQQQQQLCQLQACVPGFDSCVYSTAQLAVPASDGCLVPLSLAWNSQQLQQPVLEFRKQFREHSQGSTQPQQQQQQQPPPPLQQQQEAAPMLLTCYGSYGIKEAVGFSPELLQLLDAGWVVGVAHVRGGSWLGRAWADAGRGLGKPRSIQDLQDVAAFVQQVGPLHSVEVRQERLGG
jgi:oligopeptidase B